jgi:leucyl aminopeptidase
VLRRAAAAVVRQGRGARKAVTTLPQALPGDPAAAVQAVTEGALLAAYRFDKYKRAKQAKGNGSAPPAELTSLVLYPGASGTRGLAGALAAGQVRAAATNLARDLSNEPANALHPADLATAARKLLAGKGVTVKVKDEKALAAEGFGGIVGVGQGAEHPPRLIELRYAPKGASGEVVLVGKGITFDSGGLSLKPSAAMEWMKSDMGGAAAIIAAITAIARLGLDVNVTVWAPMAENMPSGSAQRPSDVITIYGGTTVEVLNTDAEGRLVLADGIVRASEEKPDLLIDVATLTGAQLVALGARTAGVMANNDELRAAIIDAADTAGEQMWPMPLPVELRAAMESTVADISNMGDRYGGMLTGGLFLKEFVGEGIRWAHLDIAGPSYNDAPPHGYTPKGGTGHAVRTLVRLAENLADGALAGT